MRTARWVMLGVVGAAVAFGCNAILGIGDFSVGPTGDASSADGRPGPVTDGATDAPVCNGFDPGSGKCFPCTPQNNLELLNACTTGCVPFDDTARITNFAPDGALPTVPDPDGGAG